VSPIKSTNLDDRNAGADALGVIHHILDL